MLERQISRMGSNEKTLIPEHKFLNSSKLFPNLRFFAYTLFLSVLMACGFDTGTADDNKFRSPSLLSVSEVRLIGDRRIGEKITVFGYFEKGGNEVFRLYDREEQFRFKRTLKQELGLQIEFAAVGDRPSDFIFPEDCYGQNVTVTGVLVELMSGQLGLVDVLYISSSDYDPKFCYPQ